MKIKMTPKRLAEIARKVFWQTDVRGAHSDTYRVKATEERVQRAILEALTECGVTLSDAPGIYVTQLTAEQMDHDVVIVPPKS